jgi:hypothetical protein
MDKTLPNRDLDLRKRGGLVFYEKEHAYYNADGIKYTGMTTFLKDFCAPFKADETAKYKAIKNSLPEQKFKDLKKLIVSKLNESNFTAWSKVHLFYEKICESNPTLGAKIVKEKENILADWAKSTNEGSIEHDKREKDVIENGITWKGKYYPYMNKTILDVTKDDVCVIPEIMVWDHESQLCGLIDLPIFDKGVVHILDYKTNKKIEKTSFMNKVMSGVFRKFKDCNFSKYSAQLSGYQKMACDLTGFEPGEKWIIHTANEKYKRKNDAFIECIDMNKEIEIAFKTFR